MFEHKIELVSCQHLLIASRSMYRCKAKRFFPLKSSGCPKNLLSQVEENKRSPMNLSLIKDDDETVRPQNHDLSRDPYMRIAIAKASRSFKLPELIPMIHLKEVFEEETLIWSAPPGLPWNQKGYKTREDIKRDPDAIERVRWFWHRLKDGEKLVLPDYCAGEYPASITFAEAVFVLPLIEAYTRAETPLAYGYENGNAGCKKLLDHMKGNYFLRLKFKAFDKTVPAWLIKIAFDILFVRVNFAIFKDYRIADAERMIRMWDIVADYFIDTPIRQRNGKRYQKHGGIASGSYFAQLIRSICNYIAVQYVCLKLFTDIESIKVFGDDSLLGVSKKCSPADFITYLADIGLDINIKEFSCSQYLSDLTFLDYRIN